MVNLIKTVLAILVPHFGIHLTGPADAPAPETPAPEPPAPENIPEQAAVDVRWCERKIKFPLLDFKRILGEAWRR